MGHKFCTLELLKNPKKYLSQFTPDINGCIDTSEVISILKQLNTKPTILKSELAEFEQVGYKLRLFGVSFEVP